VSEDPLKTYLEDHLAGAASAVALLSSLRDDHGDEPIGRFASEILGEVEEDRKTLEELALRIADGPHPLKDAAAKVAEKIARLKLSHQTAGPMGPFESLEFLAIGVWGKRALWRALAAVAPEDPRLSSLDLNLLISRAESQHERIEQRRIEAGKVALSEPRRATA